MPTELDSVLISIRLRQDRIQRDLAKLDRRFKRTFRGINKSVNQTRSGFEQLASSIFTVRNIIAAIGTLGVFRGFQESIKAFTDFETGLVAIGKTTGIEGRRLEDLGKKIEDLSFKLPRATTALLEIGAAAGQMGIDTEEGILAFTKTLGELELATDVIGEAGARSIARILLVTDTAITDVDRFGSVLVKLGNTAAATETEILEVAAKVGRGIAAFDVSPEFLLAISASAKELAGAAEITGTQINLLFQKINAALNAAGPGVKDFAKIMGDSIQNLTDRFNKDAEPVILEFIQRLNQLGKTNAGPALAALGLTGARINTVFGPLGDNIEIVAKNFFNAKTAWKENTALVQEAIRAADTFSSRMQIIRNVLGSVARELAGDFLDSLGRFLGKLSLSAANNIEAVAAAIRGLITSLGTLIALQFGGAIIFLLKRLTPMKALLIGVSLGISGLAGLLGTLSKQTIKVNGEMTTLSRIFTVISQQIVPAFMDQVKKLSKLFEDTFKIDMTLALDFFLSQFAELVIKFGAGTIALISSVDQIVTFFQRRFAGDRSPQLFDDLVGNIKNTFDLAEDAVRAGLGALALTATKDRPKGKPAAFPDLPITDFTLFGSELDKVLSKTRLNIKVLSRDTDDYRGVLLRLIDAFNLTPTQIEEFAEKLKEVDEALKQQEGLEKLQDDLDTFKRHFEDAFDDILDSAVEGKIDLVNIFTTMVDEIIKEILRLSIIDPILKSIFGDKNGGGGLLGLITQGIGLGASIAGAGGGQAALDAQATGTLMDANSFGSASNFGRIAPQNITNTTNAAPSQTTIIIDARNSIGEEALNTSIQNALVSAMPQLVNAATNNVIIQRRRDPHIFEN